MQQQYTSAKPRVVEKTKPWECRHPRARGTCGSQRNPLEVRPGTQTNSVLSGAERSCPLHRGRGAKVHRCSILPRAIAKRGQFESQLMPESPSDGILRQRRKRNTKNPNGPRRIVCALDLIVVATTAAGLIGLAAGILGAIIGAISHLPSDAPCKLRPVDDTSARCPEPPGASVWRPTPCFPTEVVSAAAACCGEQPDELQLQDRPASKRSVRWP